MTRQPRRTRRARPRSELESALSEQISAFRLSVDSYDSGNLWEAPRLAVGCAMLVHDGGGQQSLLSVLGHRSRMGFLDTSRFDEIKRQQKDQIILALPLVSITSIGTAVPLLGRGYLSPNKLIKFGKWWEAPILEGRNGAILSR